MPLPTKEQIETALMEVVDPEINIDIFNLGLIYEVLKDEEKKQVTVKMTLTSPGCPFGPQILSAVESKVKSLEGVEDVSVELTFSPAWNPATMATDEAKDILGIF